MKKNISRQARPDTKRPAADIPVDGSRRILLVIEDAPRHLLFEQRHVVGSTLK
jgi:hypothetical protein